MIFQLLKRSLDKGWSDKRLRRVAAGAGANFFSTSLNFLVFFVSVPLTISYLGPERFGVWMTVASLAGMLSFMDLGVGNGLVSQVAKKNVKLDKAELQIVISSGLVVLAAIGLFAALILTASNYILPVTSIFNIESAEAMSDAENLLFIFILLFAVNIPANGIYKVLLGLQLNWRVHAIKSIASIISLVLMFTLSRNEVDPIYLLMATYGVQTIAPFFLLPYFFLHKYLTVKSLTAWSEQMSEFRGLMSVGGLFLILQLGTMAAWGADTLIILSLVNASAVAQFVVVQRLFQLVSILVGIVNTPLWGAYADAHGRGDHLFIKKTMKVSLSLTLLLSAFLSLLVFFSADFIFSVWMKNELPIPQSLILGFAVWKVLESFGHSLSMALNGLHVVKPQVIAVLLLCALVLPLKFVFTPTYGVSAVVWSTVGAYTLSTLLFYVVRFRHQIRSALR